MTLKKVFFYSFFLIGFALASCEKNSYFQSEKKIKSRIQNRWEAVHLGTDWQNEVWIFNEGNLLVLTSNNGKEDTLALGVYKVKTTLSDAFIEVSGLQRAPYLNTTYTIDKLDDSVLSIYGTDGLSGNGNVYREFTKK